MHQLHDAEIAKRMLHHLAHAFGCPDAVYLAEPVRIQGGFDAAIFGFTLDRVPPPLVGPLILRLGHSNADPERVKLETVVQNTLAEMGFPAPRVMTTESDPGVLGGPFMVMTRLSGQTLVHGIEGRARHGCRFSDRQHFPPFRSACHGHCALRDARSSARLYDATSAPIAGSGPSTIRPCSTMKSSAPSPSWFGSVRQGPSDVDAAAPSIRQPG